jgi:hypothetical protein
MIDEVGVFLPVGLLVDAVDVVGHSVAAADRLDQAADAELAGLAQDAVGVANDEVDVGSAEGVVRQSDAIEFAEDEVGQIVGMQAFDDGVGERPARGVSSQNRSSNTSCGSRTRALS